MDQSKIVPSKLYSYNVLEAKDELDERLERCFGLVTSITAGLSDRESNDKLNEHVSKGSTQHDDIQHGCLYKILTDQKGAAKAYRDLTFLSRDSMTTILTRTNQLIHEKWIKLLDIPKAQILWLCRELVKNAAPGADSVCHSLVRQIAGGDVTQKNIWLTETMLDILMDHRGWLEKFQQLIAISVYTFLRLIIDHQATQYHALRQKEVDFCVGELRERFVDCMTIGRDLIRLLQGVARVPEIEKLWKDILHNPSVLSPTFTGIHQLMQMRTSRRLIASRLTPDMENKLAFLMSKVRFGQQKRYQDWFQRQYLSTPESQSLRCDLIRYICAVIHPSNEILSSDIIPRWAVIGWLLTTCTSNVAASNAKLALFYDWLFFGPEKDSIMNIEPCILVMYHSMRPHPAITATLLDFMCRIMTNFYPPLTPQVKMGMYTSLRIIQEKRVLASLSPLFDNPKLDRELRTMLRECFQEFCSAEVVKEEPATNNHRDVVVIDMPESTNHLDGSRDSRDDSLSEVAEFSDDEDDIPLEKLRNELNFRPIRELAKFEPIDTSEYLQQLEDDFRECVEELQQETNKEDQCEIMDKLVQLVIKEDIDQDIAAPLAMCLCQILGTSFSKLLFPEDPNEDTIEDSTGSSLFVIFRNLCQTPEEDPSRQPILLLLEEMYNKQPRVGYYFLYFLKVSKVHDEKMSAYKDFCNSMEARDIQSCLMNDLRLCQEDDVRLFTFLLPDIFTQFANIAVGNAELLHIIVSSIDGIQLQDLICQILQGHLVMFRRDSFVNVLNASLEWETIEQYFLWQLISGHNIPVEHIMPILPKLEFINHAEAMTSIMVLLKQECPNMEMLRPIMMRECKKSDFFTVSILKYWSQEYEDDLASLLKNMLTKSVNTPNKKRNRQMSTSKSKEGPAVEQVLSHLEHLRQTCKNISFLTHETLQEGLRHIQMTGSDAQKTRFSELLALAEDFEEMRTTRVLRQVPSRRASQATALMKLGSNNNSGPSSNKSKKSSNADDSDSADEFSDEEDVKPPKSKKRKKANTVDDDSD